MVAPLRVKVYEDLPAEDWLSVSSSLGSTWWHCGSQALRTTPSCLLLGWPRSLRMETGEVSKVTHSRYGLLSVSCTAPATPKMCNSGRCARCSHASSRVWRRRDCLGLRLLIRTRNLPEELPMLRSEVLQAGCHCLVRPRVELSIQLRWIFRVD